MRARLASMPALLNRADCTLPLMARFLFAATLLMYFWVSGMTKLDDSASGLLHPSVGAYAQIFPRVMEAVSFDVSQLSVWHRVVVLAGTLAEFILPALIVIGLFTRTAAFAMIGFIVVQSLTDVVGHGGLSDPSVIGAWFDRFPNSAILDQRSFWIFTLLVLVIKGAGALSLDRALSRIGPG